MNKNNFGYIKKAFNKQITNNIIRENNEINLLEKFIKILKNSDILMLEYLVFNNLENKTIITSESATRYINDNLKLFNKYNKKTVISENKKLSKIFDVIGSIEKNELYEAIDYLILENCSDNKLPNIDKLHDSFEVVLEHLKKNKETNKHNIEENLDFDMSHVINYKIHETFKKHSNLSEQEQKILKTIVNSNLEEKINLYETLKEEILNKLKSLPINEKIEKVKNKLNSIVINENNFEEEIIKIQELKSSL
jgi:hypothetical protein